MSLDLNNPLDFAKATLSSVSGALNQLTGLNNEKWDIQESAYGHGNNLVIFHVFKSAADYNAAVDQVQDTFSRRIIAFEFPYEDGQTTDDLGRHGQNFDFNIILHGPNYYAAYLALIEQFKDPRPGTLIHPVTGRKTAKFKDAVITHQSSARQAVALKVRFVEHNFEVSFQSAKSTTKSALATAVGFIAAIANVLNKIESNLNVATNVRRTILTELGIYQQNYTATLVSMNTTFNNGTSSDIPGLLPVNNSATAFPTAFDPNDPFAGLLPQQLVNKQSIALAALQAIDLVIALRNQLTALILLMEAAERGQGSLIYYDEILSLKQSSLAIQSTLELGLQSSNATVKKYRVPVLMSLREVCFANNIAVDRAYELEQLNPDILSANYIPADTILQVPSV